MELRDIEIFLVVAEELHSDRTSRRVRIAPAARGTSGTLTLGVRTGTRLDGLSLGEALSDFGESCRAPSCLRLT